MLCMIVIILFLIGTILCIVRDSEGEKQKEGIIQSKVDNFKNSQYFNEIVSDLQQSFDSEIRYFDNGFIHYRQFGDIVYFSLWVYKDAIQIREGTSDDSDLFIHVDLSDKYQIELEDDMIPLVKKEIFKQLSFDIFNNYKDNQGRNRYVIESDEKESRVIIALNKANIKSTW